MGTVDQLRPFQPPVVEKPESQIQREISRVETTVTVRDDDGVFHDQDIPVHEYVPVYEGHKGFTVLFAPGYSAGPKSLEPFLKELAKKGTDAITYDAPSGVSGNNESSRALKEWVENMSDRDMATKETPSAHHLNKAAALLEVVRQKNFDGKIDAIGHSEGCIYLVLAALAKPEKFHTLLLVNPGGMVGEDDFFSLIGRAFKHMMQEREDMKKNPAFRSALSSGKNERRRNLARDIFRGAVAPRAIACSQIEELLLELKNKGIRIVIAHSEGDQIFTFDKVKELSRNKNKIYYEEGSAPTQRKDGKRVPKPYEEQTDEERFWEEQGRFLDGFVALRGGHNNIMGNDPDLYAELAHGIFSGIEKREQREAMEAREQEEAIRKAA